ncbi:MAG: 4'-phosphopantetheinyl transferase superfamily protein [Ginsengibacter sp.]
MPLFYQHTINDGVKIGVWHIVEPESFFLNKVPLPNIITHWHKRLQHLAGRYLLQELYPDFPYHLIEIADTRKPFLPNEEYHFSVSHCGDCAAVIISKTNRVGVDIEISAPKIERIKYKFLNNQELYLHPEAGKKLLTLFWSAKEAVYKWYGEGEVDFKKHINITQADITLNGGIILCEFSKEEVIFLSVSYIFFGEICLAWIIQ